MKCLSIRQPWATLIVKGVRSCDRRSWRTKYRGALAIHAGRTLGDDVVELCRRPPLRQLLGVAGYLSVFDLPRGRILGVVELIDCQDAADEGMAAQFAEWGPGSAKGCKFIWRLAEPRALAEPVALSAKRGVFDIPDLF